MLKKYWKYLLPAGVLILALVIFLICFYNIPRLSYRYVKEEEVYYVSKAYGNASEYTIPETYKDKPVTGIDTRAFYRHSGLKRINLSQNITVIGRLAFSECRRLESISLENVETIYRNAFSYCVSLTSLELNAADIGASAFYKCENLSEVKLNEGLKTIGSMAFSATKIQNISIPRSVEVLGSDCFSDCFALRNINVYGNNLKNNTYLKGLNIVNYIG